MNHQIENSLHGNRVSNQGNGEGLPFNQKDPNVYFMVSGSYDNILKAYINNIWGSIPSKSNLTSFSKVNVGDYIVTYCSVTKGEDKDKQGFHTIGRVTNKRDPEYIDEFTWDRPYGCIVDVEWLNVPRKDRVLTLEEAQELSDFSKWRFCLCSGQYTSVSDKGWGYKSLEFLILHERLVNGFVKRREPGRKLKITNLGEFVDQWSPYEKDSGYYSTYKVLHMLEKVVGEMKRMEEFIEINYTDNDDRWVVFKFVSIKGGLREEVYEYKYVDSRSI